MSETLGKSLAKFSIGAAMLIALLISVYIIILAVDVAAGALVYYSTLSAVLGTGAVSSVNLAKAITIVFTIAFYLIVPITVWNFIRFRKTKAVLVFGGLYIVWFMFLWGMSLANPHYIFNPIEGTARFNFYKSPSGEIELFPKDVQFHPQIGAKLSAVTTEVMQEYINKYPDRMPVLRNSGYVLNKPKVWKGCVPKLEPGQRRNPAKITYDTGMENIFGWKVFQSISVSIVGAAYNEAKEPQLTISAFNEKDNEALPLSEQLFKSSYLTDSSSHRFEPKSIYIPSSVNSERFMAPEETVLVTITFESSVSGQNPSSFYLSPGQPGLQLVDCSE